MVAGRALWVGVSLGLTACPVAAESAIDRLFPSLNTCYARDYLADHLASRPRQRSASLALTPEDRSPVGDLLILRVTATVRDLPGEVLTAVAYCEPGGNSLACGMEGDAGGFTISAARDGAVMVEVSARGMGFEGAQDFVTFEADRGDDRSFLLRPTPRCR